MQPGQIIFSSAGVGATSHMATYAISRARLLDLAAKSPNAAKGMFAYMRGRYESH